MPIPSRKESQMPKMPKRSKKNPAQTSDDAHSVIGGTAAADQSSHDAQLALVSSSSSSRAQQKLDAHNAHGARAAADQHAADAQSGRVSSGTDFIVDQIRAYHRKRRFAIKMQQKLDRQ